MPCPRVRSDGSVAYRVCFRYVIATIFESLASVTKVSEAFFLLFAVRLGVVLLVQVTLKC